MKQLYLSVLIFTISATTSFAQTGETEMYNALDTIEAELKTVFNNLETNLSNPSDKKSLLDSQEKWLEFRDSNCSFKSQQESQGGVISNKLFISCKISETELRTKELRDLLENESED